MNVGFIGLGAMGSGMARNLLRAGFAVTVWDREEEPMATLVAEGAARAAIAAEAGGGDVVVSMLAHDEAVRGVVLDGDWLRSARTGLIHVNCSTISVAFAKILAERHTAAGLDYVAAPVFGRPDAAASAQLNLIAAGPATALDRVGPLLAAIGHRT